ncbi:secreted protein [Melampsora americana]|nr:secreted protein [Melampsora americana]
MHFIKAFFILAITLISHVSSECNTAGSTWGTTEQKAKLKKDFPTICRTLTGTYPVASVAKRCSPSGTLKYEFSLKNVSKNVTRMNNKLCQAGFASILNCEKGGVEERNGWKFRGIPSTGKC